MHQTVSLCFLILWLKCVGPSASPFLNGQGSNLR
ncbi:hypothetical protein Pvag_pPag30032 (plasmid) [Pantoea vagans C9-1]|nr:hypothetical protein Pvag_pPag30032 [Pantoea vagans C9-1]